jgi:hypothetical protein
LNSCRSSAMRIAPSLAPMSSTLWRSSTPDCEMGRKEAGGGRAGFGGNARERAWCAKGSYATQDASARRRRWRRGSCSHLGEGDGEVERRLAAHSRQQRIRLLLLFANAAQPREHAARAHAHAHKRVSSRSLHRTRNARASATSPRGMRRRQRAQAGGAHAAHARAFAMMPSTSSGVMGPM